MYNSSALQSGKPSVSRGHPHGESAHLCQPPRKKIISFSPVVFRDRTPTPSPWMLLAFLLAAATASAQARRIQLDDETKIVSVSDPQISPDGKSIVCVVRRPSLDEDRYDNKLVLVEVATGAQRMLTFDRKDVASPRWSPGGDRLAFVTVAPYANDKKDDTTKKKKRQPACNVCGDSSQIRGRFDPILFCEIFYFPTTGSTRLDAVPFERYTLCVAVT